MPVVIYAPKYMMTLSDILAMWRYTTAILDKKSKTAGNNYVVDDATRKQNELNGMRGETAFHIWQWMLHWLRYARWNYKGRADFASFVELKAITEARKMLCVHDPLEMDRPYVLSFEDKTWKSDDLVRFELRGWRWGHEIAKIPLENRCRDRYRPAHYTNDLRPMSELMDVLRCRGLPLVEDHYDEDFIREMREGWFNGEAICAKAPYTRT